jgi:hypothetical protein
MTKSTVGPGEENIAYPSNPIDVHTPPPPPMPPPPRAPAVLGAVAALLALGAYLYGQGVLAGVITVVAQALLILYLSAIPYTGPVNNPPPPPPPIRRERVLIAVAAILFGIAMLSLAIQSRPGFLGAGVAGLLSVAGGLLLPGGKGASMVPGE